MPSPLAHGCKRTPESSFPGQRQQPERAIGKESIHECQRLSLSRSPGASELRNCSRVRHLGCRRTTGRRWPTAVRAQGAEAVSSTTGWAPLGPSAISDFYKSAGRVTAIAIDPTSSNTIYIGAADGGVWKTTDGGGSWVPLTDSQCSLAMGALAIDPVTPTIVYAGTGELNLTADNYGGCGVLRSTDGGNDRQATGCWGLNCKAATS